MLVEEAIDFRLIVSQRLMNYFLQQLFLPIDWELGEIRKPAERNKG